MRKAGFVDVVDEGDNRIGQISEEEAATTRDKITRAIAVFVLNPRGEIFLQKRSRKKIKNPLYWTASVSGYVDVGESYLDAAARETREELGIEVEPLDLEFLEKVFLRADSPQFVHVYRLSWDGPISPDSSEIDSGKFFSLYDIKKMIAQGEKFTRIFLALFDSIFIKGDARAD